MKHRQFFPFLEECARRNDTLLCVGLDPQPNVAAREIFPRNKWIVNETSQSACIYKPNIAFYEARGREGLDALKRTISYVHGKGLPVLLDAKRGDISSTAEAYAAAVFDVWDADAVTLNPLLGGDSIEPFASRDDRGLFVLCHTSNPGARDIQELDCGGAPLYEKIASLARSWNSRGNIGLVIGATYPEVLARIRAIAPDMWLLLPGVGTQGGDLEASLEAGISEADSGIIVNVGRAIYNAKQPGSAAAEYRDRIRAVRAKTRSARRAPAAWPATLEESVALGLHDLGAVRFGEFILKSGQSSPIYIDLRLLVSDPKLMSLVARALAKVVEGISFDRIAAIPYGGLPIGQAVALVSGKPLIYPRREAKDYGTRKLIEGKYESGETALVLDDLITTGGSKLEAIAPLAEAGLLVKDVAVLVDREQGGKEELSRKGIALHSVLNLSRLLDILVDHGTIEPETRARVRAALGLG